MQNRNTFIGIALVAVIVVMGVGVFMWHKHQSSVSARPVTKFLIENAATPGKSSSDFAQEQLTVGDNVRIDTTYNPQLLQTLAVRFVSSDGKTAKTTAQASVGSSGVYAITIPTSDMAADIYRVELINQDQKVIDFGELTLTTTKN